MRPKILKELVEDEWEPLHIAYALSHLFHGRLSHSLFPDDYVGVAKYGIATTFLMLDLHYNFLHDVERMRVAGITQGMVRCVGSTGGSCDACVKRNEIIVDLGDMPELPYEHCTHLMGCRCLVQAHFLPKS